MGLEFHRVVMSGLCAGMIVLTCSAPFLYFSSRAFDKALDKVTIKLDTNNDGSTSNDEWYHIYKDTEKRFEERNFEPETDFSTKELRQWLDENRTPEEIREETENAAREQARNIKRRKEIDYQNDLRSLEYQARYAFDRAVQARIAGSDKLKDKYFTRARKFYTGALEMSKESEFANPVEISRLEKSIENLDLWDK